MSRPTKTSVVVALLVLGSAVALTARYWPCCRRPGSPRNFDRIEIGMTQAEVRRLLWRSAAPSCSTAMDLPKRSSANRHCAERSGQAMLALRMSLLTKRIEPGICIGAPARHYSKGRGDTFLCGVANTLTNWETGLGRARLLPSLKPRYSVPKRLGRTWPPPDMLFLN